MSLETRPRLAVLLAHLDRYPHLDDGSIARAEVNDEGIEVHVCPHAGGRLALLAVWVRVMADVDHILVKAISENSIGYHNTHLVATGLLAGVPFSVRVLVNDDEADLLAAHTVVERDATFPVDLLLRLAAPAVEPAAPAACDDKQCISSGRAALCDTHGPEYFAMQRATVSKVEIGTGGGLCG